MFYRVDASYASSSYFLLGFQARVSFRRKAFCVHTSMFFDGVGEGLASSFLGNKYISHQLCGRNHKCSLNLMVLESCPKSSCFSFAMLKVSIFEPKMEYQRKKLDPLCHRL